MSEENTDSSLYAANQEVFGECVSTIFIRSMAESETKERSKTKKKQQRRKKDSVQEAEHVEGATAGEDLAEFIEYLASEMFISLPTELQSISWAKLQTETELASQVSSGEDADRLFNLLPPAVIESIETYTQADARRLFSNCLSLYLEAATKPPPVWIATKATACELCEREHIPLTYHHLIPRSTHDKVRKRGWHEEWDLNKVAWLCGACHRCVHRVTTNEDLARNFHTVELLKTREDVQAFVKWVGRIRWKKR